MFIYLFYVILILMCKRYKRKEEEGLEREGFGSHGLSKVSKVVKRN